MPHAVKDDLACRRSINAAVPGDLVALAVQLAFEVCAGVTPPGGEVVFDAIFAKADKANEVFPYSVAVYLAQTVHNHSAVSTSASALLRLPGPSLRTPKVHDRRDG
jgi:hypothetical protein